MSAPPSIDAEGFTRLWVPAQPIVSAYISALVPNVQDAQDILQKVALTALQKLNQYDASRPFCAWVIGMARFEILVYRRQQARGLLVLSESLDTQLAETCEMLRDELEERRSFLRECLQLVRGRSLTLLRFRYEEALSFEEIARRLRIKQGAARVAIVRVRAFLRECIERRLKLAES
jgi:RNA polymerase sigma-70 factor, ECF subfamily